MSYWSVVAVDLVMIDFRFEILLRPVYTGDFCCSNSMQFLLRRSCNFKTARVNHSAISVRF